jgi:hypothetical protein
MLGRGVRASRLFSVGKSPHLALFGRDRRVGECLLLGGYCCKSRKLHQSEFLVKPHNARRSMIRITSVALPKSPMSFA